MLQGMPIFGGIRDGVLEAVLARASIVDVRAGRCFFRQDERGDSLFVLERGKAVVLRSWHGHEYVLHEFGQGDCFGEMSLVDLGLRTASVQATEDCTAIQLTNADLLSICSVDVEQFALIQMNIGREICRRLRTTDAMLFQERVEADRIAKGRPRKQVQDES